MVRLESKGYPPNSVIVGMPEGYYVHCDDGGYPSPRRPSFHRIMDYLPPQSLIEVRRSEVREGGKCLIISAGGFYQYPNQITILGVISILLAFSLSCLLVGS